MAKQSTKAAATLVSDKPSLRARLFKIRADLANQDITKTFEIKREFEAFSIHKLAEAVEHLMIENGVAVECHITKWHKSGNHTILEGKLVFECEETGEVREVPCVGEAADNGDKGIGKANSYLRKVGFINAFNLAIGTDNEAHDVASSGVQPVSGTPPQAASPVAQEGKYEWQDLDGNKVLLSAHDTVNCIVGYISSINVDQIDGFVKLNAETVERFKAEQSGFWFAIQNQINIATGAKQEAA